MALYDGVAAVAREVSKKYDGVSAVAREVSVAYDGVSGVAREYFKSGTPIGNLAVGSTVYMKVNRVSKAFLVVQQGRPSTAYDSSCNGTWLLMKDCYESKVWGSDNFNDYGNYSDIHKYLNGTFLGLFDSAIQSAIKQIKLPYTNNAGAYGSVATGSSGLSTKAFLLSYTEVGFSGSSGANVEGAVLSYFSGAANSKRVCYYNGTATRWWLRSPWNQSTTAVWNVEADGSAYGSYNAKVSFGIRPCLILPSTQLVDSSFNVVAA